MGESGEDRGTGPLVMFAGEAVHLGGKGQEKGGSMLSHTGCGVTGHVADRYAPGPGRLEIDHVDTGGAYQDEFQIGKGFDDPGIEDDLVGENNLHLATTLGDLGGSGVLMGREGAQRFQGPEVDIAAGESGGIEKGDVHGGGGWMFGRKVRRPDGGLPRERPGWYCG